MRDGFWLTGGARSFHDPALSLGRTFEDVSLRVHGIIEVISVLPVRSYYYSAITPWEDKRHSQGSAAEVSIGGSESVSLVFCIVSEGMSRSKDFLCSKNSSRKIGFSGTGLGSERAALPISLGG